MTHLFKNFDTLPMDMQPNREKLESIAVMLFEGEFIPTTAELVCIANNLLAEPEITEEERTSLKEWIQKLS